MVEPSHPFKGCDLDGLLGFPWGASMNQLGFVQAVNRFSQRIVITVTPAIDRWLDLGLGQPTMRRANTSVTNATYNQPCQVGT